MDFMQNEVVKRMSGRSLIGIALSSKMTKNKLTVTEKRTGLKWIKENELANNDELFILAHILNNLFELDLETAIKKIDQSNLQGEEHDPIDIRSLRKSDGISQKEMAIIFCVSEATMQRWETKLCPSEYAEAIKVIHDYLENKTTKKTALMRMRWNNNMDIETAANAIDIQPEKLWKYEFENRCPLNLLPVVAAVYYYSENEIPVKANQGREQYIHKLKDIRLAYGMTIDQAAEAYGLTKTRYKNIEMSDDKHPSYDEIRAIASYYNLTPEDLLITRFVEKKKIRQCDIEAIEYYRKIKNIKLEDFLKEIGLGYKAYRKAQFKREKLEVICSILKVKPSSILAEKEKKDRIVISSKLIKKAREQCGLTRSFAASQLSIRTDWLRAIENGKRPSLQLLSRIAELYDKSVDDFIDEKSKKRITPESKNKKTKVKGENE